MRKRGQSSSRPDELDEFKRRINLSEYAATLGYAIDRRASGRNSAVMKHPAGPKIIVARDEDDHWIYFSVGDSRDSGSIIDFVQRRQAGSLGEVRKILRPWVGRSSSISWPTAETFAAELVHMPRDLIAVQAEYEGMQPIDGSHPYLENVRQIPPHVLSDPRFADRIRTDRHGNAVFPHHNRDGLCGYEQKNVNFTRYAPGGVKGLWFSKIDPADHHLIIAETAIDALSYAAMHYRPGSRFVSTAGELSPDQLVLLQRAMEKMPDGSEIILAVDHDPGGTQIGSKIEAIFGMVNRPSLAIKYDRPPGVGHDWNDELKSSPAAAVSRPMRPRPRP